MAAKARKPVLASASPSSMMEAVSRYRLGVGVEPDSLEAIVEGMQKLVNEGVSSDWSGYQKAASWDVNAKAILAEVR